MGIQGLLSFIKSNKTFLAERQSLSNTRLVVDCNNLINHLMDRTCMDKEAAHYRADIYGGNLVAYGQAVRAFFASLDSCGITPLLVIDGSPLGKRMRAGLLASAAETSLMNRTLETLKRSLNMSELPHTDADQFGAIIPRLVKQVFRSIATELNIETRQMTYEANGHIARLANELDCPVLTNDSNFAIYPLTRGFIILGDLKYEQAAERGVLECHVYSRDKLAACVPGLAPDAMPLLPVLIGKDSLENKTFTSIRRFISRNQYAGPLNAHSRRHQEIVNLLAWMSRRSLADAIDRIVNSVSSRGGREQARQYVQNQMAVYEPNDEHELGAELEAVYCSTQASSAAAPSDIEQMPANYLRKLFDSYDLRSPGLDIIFRNTHYDSFFLDDFSRPSSSLVQFTPYSLALVLLRPKSYDKLDADERRLQSRQDAYHIYVREHDGYVKRTIEPMHSLDRFGPLDTLDCYSMIRLDEADKRTLLMATFKFGDQEWRRMAETLSDLFEEAPLLSEEPSLMSEKPSFVSEACLCLLLVRYVGLDTGIAPESHFVAALVLTFCFYAHEAGYLNPHLAPAEACGRLSDRLRQYPGVAGDDQDSYRQIIHMISSLQAAYEAYCFLNVLLNHVCYAPKHDKWFNGTLIFRLAKRMRTSVQELDKLCEDLPNLRRACRSLFEQIDCGAV